MGGLTNFAIVCDFLSALILIGVARRSASIFRTLTSFCKGYSLSDKHVFVPKYTGKSFSEILILASANPQYDKRLSIDLPVQYIKIPNLEHRENMGENMLLTQVVLNVKTKKQFLYTTFSKLFLVFMY